MGRPDQSEVAARADVAKGGAFVAHMYDLVLALGEKRSMGELRRKTIADAGGSVLEIGAGTGLNTEYYPKDLERLVICEPEENMVEQLRKRVESLGVEAEVVRAAAEALPFDDDSFDTVTAMLVLCTVDDPAASIAEIRRVLKPGGRFLLVEHVHAGDGMLGRWQNRLMRPWRAVAAGCHCNRDTLSALASGGFDVSKLESTEWRGMPPLVRPLIVGSAANAG